MTKNPTADVQAALLEKLIGAVSNSNDTMTQMVTGMKTRDGVRQLGTNPVAVLVSGTPLGNAGVVSSSPGVIGGIVLRETAGVATVVNIFDGIDTGGGLVYTVALPANGSVSQWLLPGGISHSTGIFVQVVAAGATVQAILYRAPVQRTRS